MYQLVGEGEFDVEAFRVRLRRMTDAQLRRYGEAGAFLCRPEQCVHGKPREVFVIQLEETRAEWRRRHPKVLQEQERGATDGG